MVGTGRPGRAVTSVIGVGPPLISSLHVGDRPEVWTALGFTVVDRSCWIGGVRHRLGAEGEGLVAWTLSGVEGLAELPVAPEQDDGADAADRPGDGRAPEGTPPADPAATEAGHPNGVIAVDHVVVLTPDLARTIDAFEGSGVGLRRIRDVPRSDPPTTQAFFKLGAVIAEVVGPTATAGPGPARLSGLAFTVADLDATAAYLGDRLRPAKDAVQRGRRIATLDTAAGSSVPIAFMSADRR